MSSKKQKTISVALIVRDESEVIERCLRSVTPFADEIIVVDTGSVDKTKELAGQYTDKIFDFVWIDDFSAARNAAFERATGDYIFWLDADDVVPPYSAEKLNRLKRQLGDEHCIFMLYDVPENGCMTLNIRMVKRTKAPYWTGMVHETLIERQPFFPTDIVIWHRKKTPMKRRRNIRIMERIPRKTFIENFWLCAQCYLDCVLADCPEKADFYLACAEAAKPCWQHDQDTFTLIGRVLCHHTKWQEASIWYNLAGKTRAVQWRHAVQKDMTWPCLFSIIIPFHNSEPFLRQTLNSVVNQAVAGISHHNVYEIILVDDGSTDGSLAVALEYTGRYSHIRIVRQKNGGVASARNLGLAHACGKYINFLDSDDMLTPNALQEVYDFFEKNEQCDIVTMPLFFFDGASGAHSQNRKFGFGRRVVNLLETPDCELMYVTSTFFRSNALSKIRFDISLIAGEDFMFVYCVLLQNPVLGLITSCSYLYRIRTCGETSFSSCFMNKHEWYTSYFTDIIGKLAYLSTTAFGHVAPFVQYALIADLRWRIVQEYTKTACQVQGKAGFARYKNQLWKAFKNIEDDFLLLFPDLNDAEKLFILRHKYHVAPQIKMELNAFVSLSSKQAVYNGMYLVAQKDVFSLSRCSILLEKITARDDTLCFIGSLFLPFFPDQAQFRVVACVDGEILPCQEKNEATYRLGEPFLQKKTFVFPCRTPGCIRFLLASDGDLFACGKLCAGKELPETFRFQKKASISGWQIHWTALGLNVTQSELCHDRT